MKLPASICFRVTRSCNARCGFCLAPSDGLHPRTETLSNRIDWLVEHGVRVMHFCGGEPTIHPGLAALVAHTHALGATPKLTTNGITIRDELLATLAATATSVKVSIHGDRDEHDALVGRVAYDRTVTNLRRLVAAGVPTAVQTTLVQGNRHVVDDMVGFCLHEGVRRLSFLPFIARGDGQVNEARFALSSAERIELRSRVKAQRHARAGRLDVRWVDFATRPVPVAEVDGTLVIEGANEALDRTLCRIPDPADQMS